MASDALAVLVAFLCGSVPFGVILVFLFRGIDVRRVGSGNIGATNAMRAGGAWVGVAVLALDALKGVVGVLLGRAVAGGAWNHWGAPWLEGALALAAIAGHVFTPWLRFRGGKGIAAALGVLIALDWRLAVAALAAFLIVCVPTRIVSAGSLAAATTVAVGGFLCGDPVRRGPFLLAAALLVVWRHRENIVRLMRGEESRLGQKRLS